MTDVSTDMPPARIAGRQRGTEFKIYFALIFFLALPFAMERWVAHVIRRRSLNVHGPLARAWAEADRITPLIFSA